MPGGGYPGGGGGYPGGGGGYPGGRGGGQYPDDESRGGIREQVVVRWESAMPVQQAMLRKGGRAAEESKAAGDASQKYYVVTVLGLTLPSPGRDADSNESQSADELRTRFLDAAQLVPRSKIAISADDIQFEGRNGSVAMRFLFPRTFPITADEKEIEFRFQSRGVKFEHKFRLNDMVYRGQFAL